MRKINITICQGCQVEKSIHSRGLCDNCYRRQLYDERHPVRKPHGPPPKDRSNATCARCQKVVGGYLTKGLCHTCYHQDLRKAWGPEDRAKRILEAQRYRDANPEWYAASKRQRAVRPYGLTIEAYEEILHGQGGLCALCRRPPGAKRLSVDHDHTKVGKGAIRALLCERCNFLIGHMEEAGPEIVIAAQSYLQKHA